MTHDFLILGLNAEPKCESCCFSSAHFNSIFFFSLAAPHKQKVGTLSVPDMRQICRSVSPSKQATRSAFPFFLHMSTLFFFFNGHKFSHKLT